MASSAIIPPSLALWRDRSGAFSPARALALALAIAPALPLALRIFQNDLGPRPLTEVSHETGLWAIRLLAATMAITPVIEILRMPRLVAMRRILGVSVFVWMIVHFSVFVADKMFDPAVVIHEIVARIYLLIGLVALLMLGALAATSTDGAIRRLGAARWKALHRLVYAVVLLGMTHYFMQSKIDITEPTALAGTFALLGALRLPKRFGRLLAPPVVVAIAIVVSAATAVAEAGWFAWSMGATFGDVIAADFTLDIGLRPCWQPMIVGLAFAAIGFASAIWKPRQSGRRGARPDANDPAPISAARPN